MRQPKTEALLGQGHLQRSAFRFEPETEPDAGDGTVADEAYKLGLKHLAGDTLPAAAPLGVAYLKRAAGVGRGRCQVRIKATC